MVCKSCQNEFVSEICLKCMTPVVSEHPSNEELKVAYKTLDERFKRHAFIRGIHLFVIFVVIAAILLAIALPVSEVMIWQ